MTSSNNRNCMQPAKIPPLIHPMDVQEQPLPVVHSLPNGIPLYSISGDGKPALRLEILFKGGYGVQDKPLQATVTNRMLREGAAGMTGQEISQKLDYYGAWIETYSSQNCNHLVLYSLSKHFLPLVKLLEDIVKAPTFPEENLEVVKNNGKACFEVNSQKVDIVSQRYFENSLWGKEHPLAHIVEPADYDAITVDDVKSYYQKVYNSVNCVIFLSGELTDEIYGGLSDSFGNGCWGVRNAMDRCSVQPAVTEYGKRYIPVANSIQSAVKIGFMAMDASHDDFHAFRFLSVLLGGYFGSRLMSNIREENGYTYHISSEVDAYGGRNAFMISSETANEYVRPCIDEIYKEIERLYTEPIPEAEVEHVRNYILGEMCRECEEMTPKAEVFVNAWLSGNEPSSVNDYLKVVKNVTAEELSAVARRWFAGERPVIEIVAGAVEP